MRARTAILRIHADPGVGSFGDSGDFGHRWHQSQEEQQWDETAAGGRTLMNV